MIVLICIYVNLGEIRCDWKCFVKIDLCYCVSNGIKVMPPLKHPGFSELGIISYSCNVWPLWIFPSLMVTLLCWDDITIAPNICNILFILKTKKQFKCACKEKYQSRNDFKFANLSLPWILVINPQVENKTSNLISIYITL